MGTDVTVPVAVMSSSSIGIYQHHVKNVMKKNLLNIVVAFALINLSLHAFGQQSGNQPSGNLVYGADGYIYGAYTKTTNDGKRPTTIYRYLPGASTIDPIYRFPDAAAQVHLVDIDGSMFGTMLEYNASGQATYSRVFRLENDGTAYSILYSNVVSSAGVHYSLTFGYSNWLYGARTAGGWWDEGVLFSTAKTTPTSAWINVNFENASDRPTNMLPYYSWDGEGDGEAFGMWGATDTGGSFGKGSVQAFGFYYEELVPRISFTGTGGGSLDGEGPVNIVNGSDTDIYAVTQRGGINNAGAIFLISAEGNSKLHDFTTQYAQPFGKPFVDSQGKIFGLGGNFSNNTGFVYSFNPLTNTFSNVSSFNASSSVNAVTSIVSHNGVIYGVAGKTGSDSENGCLFSINNDGTSTQVIFKFIDGYSRLIEPNYTRTDASVTPSLQVEKLSGVSSYRIEISENSNFTGTVHVVNSADGLGKINSPALKYSKKYYARVKTNLIDDFGTVTTFSTHAPEKYSYVTSPAHGATNVVVNNLKVTANVVYGATLYTIELNTRADFTGTSIVRTSAAANQRTLTFNGLQPSTTYYSRTKTNLPSNWGPTRSFTTAGATPPPVFAAETHDLKVYPNPFEQHFTIEPDESQEVNVTLVDLTGREIETQLIQEPTTLGDQLTPGIYLLRIKEKDGRISVKRMIKSQ
jgi:hypothetical protein